MKIVAELHGNKFHIDATPTMTVKELKAKLAQQNSLNANRMSLSFEGSFLDDSQTLGHYQIKDGSQVTINLLMDIGVFHYHVNTPCQQLLVDPAHQTEAN